ncbi:MAG TPA: energy transducer TonB, partial [Polyangiales bacterium]|nr:energy transducer TonB [Polyangiales bacterium]
MSRLTQLACALRTACRWSLSLSLLLWAARVQAQTVFAPQLIGGETELRRAETSGSVIMELVIDRDGKVQSVQPIDVVLEPAEGSSAVVEQAEQRARELQFQPALRDREPVASRVRFQFRVVPQIAGEQSFQDAPQSPPAAGPTTPRAPPTPVASAPETQRAGATTAAPSAAAGASPIPSAAAGTTPSAAPVPPPSTAPVPPPSA